VTVGVADHGVDGRNPALSLDGFSDLQNLARLRGLSEALNLDGGGSTTMVVRGAVIIIRPIDRSRKVSDAISCWNGTPETDEEVAVRLVAGLPAMRERDHRSDWVRPALRSVADRRSVLPGRAEPDRAVERREQTARRWRPRWPP